MEFKVITRRTLLIGASSFAMIAALGGVEALIEARPAAAQNIPPDGAPGAARLSATGVLGKDDAPVTIVEYASMTCPHCAHFHETTYPELKKRPIDTGKVRFIFREFPLDLAGGRRLRCWRAAPTRTNSTR